MYDEIGKLDVALLVRITLILDATKLGSQRFETVGHYEGLSANRSKNGDL